NLRSKGTMLAEVDRGPLRVTGPVTLCVINTSTSGFMVHPLYRVRVSNHISPHRRQPLTEWQTIPSQRPPVRLTPSTPGRLPHGEFHLIISPFPGASNTIRNTHQQMEMWGTTALKLHLPHTHPVPTPGTGKTLEKRL